MTGSPLDTSRTRVLVIRHGQSTWNAEGRWQGQADPPLTAVGETQAMAAASRLASGMLHDHGPLRAIVTSDLQRAAITASIIAAELDFEPVALDKRLRERHAGEWQGLTRPEVEDRFPGYLASGKRPPNFETADVAGERAGNCLLALGRTLGGGTALVVSHGGILRALRVRTGIADEVTFANLSGQWFDVHGDRLVPGELVVLVDSERPTSASPL
jgi:probable phosphoglycerate mutase